MISRLRLKLARLAHLSPWVWIAVVFGGQALGAAAVTVWFKLTIGETLVPVMILVLGMAIAAFLAWWKHTEVVARWVRCAPLALYALFIYSLSSRSYPDARVDVNVDLFHLVEFSTLGFFLAWLWYPLLLRAGAWLFSVAVLGSGLLYALSDEFHQSFVPGRTASVIDLIYDSSALLAACVVFLAGVNLRLHLRKTSPGREK
jgi:VanZ family protein